MFNRGGVKEVILEVELKLEEAMHERGKEPPHPQEPHQQKQQSQPAGAEEQSNRQQRRQCRRGLRLLTWPPRGRDQMKLAAVMLLCCTCWRTTSASTEIMFRRAA